MVGGLIVLLAAGVGTTASAAAPGRPSGAAEKRAVTGSGLAGKLPPASQAGLVVPTGLGTSVRDTRARVNAFIPAVTALAYAFTSSRPPLDKETGRYPIPTGLLPRHPNPECNYYMNSLQNDLFAVDVDEKTHRFRSVGQFPPASVSMLAFGSLPVTATLTARQLVHGGRLEAIQANQISGGVSIRKDDPAGISSLNTGCDAEWEHYLPSPLISDGRVSATFSNVRVDGHPVDVGSDCHTATPLRLHLVGEDADHGGSYGGLLGGGPLVMAKDTRTVNPSNPIALFPDSSNLTVPPFVGCRGKSGEDVSKLITGMISGPDATVVVNQSAVLFNPVDPEHPSLCDALGSCVGLPEDLNPPGPGR